ncbi:MAG: glutamate 5-kinase [Bacillota bacterium]
MGSTIVVKIGSSSLADAGGLCRAAVETLTREIAALRRAGHQVVLVTSGAVAAGQRAMGETTSDEGRRAAAAAGQAVLMAGYVTACTELGFTAAQLLITSADLREGTRLSGVLAKLLEAGVLPVINEDDALAAKVMRNNDLVAARVAMLLGASLLVLLTDADGLHTDDPRRDPTAPVVSRVTRVTGRLLATAGGPGQRGAGGMRAKLKAAALAASAGVGVVIARAGAPDILCRAVQEREAAGTFVIPRRAGGGYS